MTTARPRGSGDSASAAEKRVPSADSSSSSSAPAPPAIGAMSAGRSGGEASNAKHMAVDNGTVAGRVRRTPSTASASSCTRGVS